MVIESIVYLLSLREYYICVFPMASKFEISTELVALNYLDVLLVDKIGFGKRTTVNHLFSLW